MTSQKSRMGDVISRSCQSTSRTKSRDHTSSTRRLQVAYPSKNQASPPQTTQAADGASQQASFSGCRLFLK